ncbi:IPT/TIG domain-containing protein [Nonomuraea sp. NPDC050556]|uniref:IPT/TIG domain-containing protein n=1 Tax=Nonomuraea sp. NPDC050556 TaxID=3364369 RepID=UPI0037A7E3F6
MTAYATATGGVEPYRVDWGDGQTTSGVGEGVEVAHTYAAPGTYTVTVTGADSGVTEVKVTVTLPAPTNLRLRGAVAPQRVDLLWDYPDLAFDYKQATTAGVVADPRAWTQTITPVLISTDRTVVLVGDASTKFTILAGTATLTGQEWANTPAGDQLPFPLWARFYMRMDARPSTACQLAWLKQATTDGTGEQSFQLGLSTAGAFTVATGGADAVATDIVPQLGQWIRVEIGLATTGDNTIEVRVCDGDDPHAAPNKVWLGQTATSLAHQWNEFTFGLAANGPAADAVVWQDLWEVSTLGWIGPYATTRRARTVRAVAGTLGFRIYRAGPDDVTAFEVIDTVSDPWVRTYTDTSLAPGGPYAYKVSAVQDLDESPYSNTVTVATTLAAPELRQWRASQNATAYLAWETPAFEWRWYNNAAKSLPGRRPWDQTDQVDGGSVADDAAVSLVGGVSTRYVLPAAAPSSAQARTWWQVKTALLPRPPFCFRFYGYADALPAVEPQIVFGLEGPTLGAAQVQVQIDNAGLLWARATGGSWTASTLSVAAGSWWRLEIGVGEDGPRRVTLRITQGSDPHAATFTESVLDVGVDLTQLTLTQAWFGIVPKAAGAWAVNQDLWAGSTAGWVGAYPQIENAGSSGTVPSGYVLQRKVDPAVFADLATITDPWASTYADNPVVDGTTYVYRVAAKYGAYQSVWSNEVSIVGAGSAPQISSVTPNIGVMDGGTQVTIKGLSFTGATGVMFGPNAGTALTVVDDETIVVTSPAGSGPIAVDVVVTTPGGSATKTGGYAYRVKDLAQLATLGDTLNDLAGVAATLEGLHEGTPQA